MLEFLKKNKLIAGIVTLLLVLILVTSWLGHKNQATKNSVTAQTQQQVTDNATGDDTAESLNALTQQLHQVINSNQQLQANNAELNKKNAEILNNIKQEVQQNIETELQKRGQDNQAKIAQLQTKLQDVNAALEKLHQQKVSGIYPVDDQGNTQTEQLTGQVIKLQGQNLIAVPDIARTHSASNSKNNSITNNDSASILHSDDITSATSSQITSKPKSTPYYTIPTGSTLARSITMTALIGRVPVNGVVKSPYPFKMIIGGDNMAANGLHIPGISGAIIQGYTVGDMALSCVKGYITTMTFIFPDGTISTTSNKDANDDNLGFNNSLGYISEPNGNPCFSGKFYTNAPKYLATMVALGALNQGGQAYALAQQTAMSNAYGGTTTSLTGSVGKYMLGGAVQGGTQQAMDWFTEREKNSFDAVYVSAGKKAVINITKQIDINYNPNGRKIHYEHAKNAHNNTSLD